MARLTYTSVNVPLLLKARYFRWAYARPDDVPGKEIIWTFYYSSGAVNTITASCTHLETSWLNGETEVPLMAWRTHTRTQICVEYKYKHISVVKSIWRKVHSWRNRFFLIEFFSFPKTRNTGSLIALIHFMHPGCWVLMQPTFMTWTEWGLWHSNVQFSYSIQINRGLIFMLAVLLVSQSVNRKPEGVLQPLDW